METSTLEELVELLSLANLAQSLLALTLAWVLLLGVRASLGYLTERFPRYRLQLGQSFPFIRLLVWTAVAGYIVFAILGPPQSVLFATLGSIGLAVGLAAQDGMRNLLAGLMIMANTPFRVGDMVEFGGHYGEVVRLDLSVTWLRTFDDSLVMVPNSEILRQPVINANAGELSEMVVVSLDLPQDLPLREVRASALDLTRCCPYCLLSKPVRLVFETRHDYRPLVRLSVKAYVLDVRYERAMASDVTERLLEGFGARGWLAQVPPPDPGS